MIPAWLFNVYMLAAAFTGGICADKLVAIVGSL